MKREVLRLSTLGRVAFLMLSLVLAATAPGWRSVVACAMIVGLVAVICPAALTVLRSPRVWLFIMLLLVPAALLLGSEPQQPGGMVVSVSGLAAGVLMALRAVSMIIAVSCFAATISVSDLSQLLERLGLRGLGFSLGVAVNMLPTIQRALRVSYEALKLRGGFRRPLLGMRLLLVTVVANSLRHADDIVGSAEARAFSPERASGVSLTWSAGDALVSGVLIATTLLVRLV